MNLGGCGPGVTRLFRPSRPDFIETTDFTHLVTRSAVYCSGLLGRTSLRRMDPEVILYYSPWDCSGLLGRTSLRRLLLRELPHRLDFPIVPAF